MADATTCPACGAGLDGPGRCPGCGLLVGGGARPAAAPADDDPAPRGRGVGLVLGLLGGLMAAGGVVAWFVYTARQREMAVMRAERMAVLEQQAAADARMAALAAERAARPGAVPDLPVEIARLFPGEPFAPGEAEERAAALGRQLHGVWREPAGGGGRVVEYRPDGTFRDAVPGPGGRVWEGRWTVAELTGTRVLHLTRTAGPPVVRVTIEGGELVHDDAPGVATVLRR